VAAVLRARVWHDPGHEQINQQINVSKNQNHGSFIGSEGGKDPMLTHLLTCAGGHQPALTSMSADTSRCTAERRTSAARDRDHCRSTGLRTMKVWAHDHIPRTFSSTCALSLDLCGLWTSAVLPEPELGTNWAAESDEFHIPSASLATLAAGALRHK
jgi:hypothetical protein